MAQGTRGNVIEGAQFRTGALSDQTGLGPFYGTVIPTSGTAGTQASVAAQGAVYIDKANGSVYINESAVAGSVSWGAT